MNRHEWPEYIVDSQGNPYRRLFNGERLRQQDVIVDPLTETPSKWQTTYSSKVGESVGADTMSRILIYYRPITDPLTSAMARALAERNHGVA
jgi:hypothetical protein